MRTIPSPVLRAALLGAAAALAACRQEPIEVRVVAKEGAPVAATSAARPAPSGLRWSAPSGWTESAGKGMRLATFAPPAAAGKAEAALFALEGDGGGELANVNRWREQLSLGPLSDRELAAERALVRAAAGPVAVYDFAGGGARTVAAIVAGPGRTWFFKLTGDAPAVSAAKPSFMKLLESVAYDR